MNLCCIFFSRYCLQEACDTQIGPFLTHFKVSEDFSEESIFSRYELVPIYLYLFSGSDRFVCTKK